MNKVLIVSFLAILIGCGSNVVDFPLPVGAPTPVTDGGVTEVDATAEADATAEVDAGMDSSYTIVEEWDSGTGGKCVCTCTP